MIKEEEQETKKCGVFFEFRFWKQFDTVWKRSGVLLLPIHCDTRTKEEGLSTISKKVVEEFFTKMCPEQHFSSHLYVIAAT